MCSVLNTEILMRQLVHLVTGFQDGDENFDLSLQYAASNFKYHRFLGVDSHEINRKLDGIVTKFTVHCQVDKASAFQRLSRQFLQCGGYEDKEYGYTDTQYAVLHALLLLARNPTSCSYKPVQCAAPEAPVGEFDWAGYLLEGEDVVHHYVDSSDASSVTSDSESAEYVDGSSVAVVAEPHTSCLSCKTKAVETELWNVDETVQTDTKNLKQIDWKHWLHDNVIIQYWSGEDMDNLCSVAHKSSCVSVDWESYLSRINPLKGNQAKNIVTEYQIMREILWMLGGVKELFMFQWDGIHFVTNDNVRVRHLTDDVLQRILLKFARYGTVVQTLQQFITNVTSPTCPFTCQTYQAFASALSDYFRKFFSVLIKLEETIGTQGTTVTLLSLGDVLQEQFKQLDLLITIYDDGIVSISDVIQPTVRSSLLLDVIFLLLLEMNDVGQSHQSLVTFLLPIWIKTFHPYIAITNDWVSSGQLNDVYNEFVIHRIDCVKTTDENYWTQGLQIECGLQKSTSDSMYSSSSDSVMYLRPVLKEIVVCGKSMELLNAIRTDKTPSEIDAQRCLYDAYVTCVQERLKLLNVDVELADSLDSPRFQESRTVRDNPSNNILLNSSDVLLNYNLSQVLQLDTSYVNDANTSPIDSTSSCCRTLNDLGKMLTSCLCLHVQQIYRTNSSRLLTILLQHYRLLDYFTTIRRIYLMEAGNALFEFYTAVIDKQTSREAWTDVSFLNSLLRECILTDYPSLLDMTDRLQVTVSSDKLKSLTPLSSLDAMSLQFNIPWPINIILNARSMSVYNDAFHFLLQIKRVKYLLDRLHFDDLKQSRHGVRGTAAVPMHQDPNKSTSDRSSRQRNFINRIGIFRMRLLHFVDSLHNYIMSRILQSVSFEFNEAVSMARDLDDIIAAHTMYVSMIHERCLLHPKVAFIRETISRVLNLALAVVDLWNNEKLAADERVEAVKEFELDFNRCIHFLSSMINKVASRGSFPHLISLSFALVTSSQVTSVAHFTH